MSDRVAGCFERSTLDDAVEIEFAGNHAHDAAAFVTETASHVADSGALTLSPLPIAPRRWLWLNPPLDRVADLERAGAVVVDVDGKWVVYSAEEAPAAAILSTAFDVETVLHGRASASIALFDCPAVVARPGPDRLLLCVASSYAASFEAALEQAASGGDRGDF